MRVLSAFAADPRHMAAIVGAGAAAITGWPPLPGCSLPRPIRWLAMRAEERDRLLEGLRGLARVAQEMTGLAVEDGTLQAFEYPYWQRVLTGDFTYGPRGLEAVNYKFERRVSTVRPVMHLGIIERIQKSAEYTRVLQLLAELLPSRQPVDQGLSQLVTRLMSSSLGQLKPSASIDQINLRFVSDLVGEPANYGAHIDLQGILLEPTELNLAIGISIRRPRRDDLEIEIPYYPFSASPLHEAFPTAIATIEIRGTAPADVQREVEKLVAILRLYRVGPARYLSYRVTSDSVLNAGGYKIGSGLPAYTQGEPAMIATRDESSLRHFWTELRAAVPTALYSAPAPVRADELQIAFSRYSESLLRNVSLEERLALAVSGLEALLIEEEQELGYKLRVRTAKLLSFFREAPKTVAQEVKDAYKIRSLFSHGGTLSAAQRKKLDTRHGLAEVLLTRILDHLRRALLTRILVKDSKPALIELIDASLIDDASHTHLAGKISPVIELLAT